MALAIVAQIPISTIGLTQDMVDLVDKKIASTSLDRVETFLHTQLMNNSQHYKEFYESKFSRIHWINDVYTRVFDLTRSGGVSIVDGDAYEEICIDRVKFYTSKLCRLNGIDFAVVAEATDGEGYAISFHYLASKDA
jgi:hypothetical protein